MPAKEYPRPQAVFRGSKCPKCGREIEPVTTMCLACTRALINAASPGFWKDPEPLQVRVDLGD
jgi:uncharacterized OB-fold protein